MLAGVDESTSVNFGVIPHFRFYFGAKKASGFFIEANTAVVSIEEYDYTLNFTSTSASFINTAKRNVTAFGLGAAAGGKFLTKSGFVGEAYLGLGRLFGNHDDEFYPRFGITIGKRF